MKRKLLIAGAISIVGMYMLSFSASRPTDIGVSNGKLAPLPGSPNAISSQTDDANRKLPPIPFESDPALVMKNIVTIIDREPRTKIVKQTEHYLHVEFTSLIFRFVDDVEFFIDTGEKVVHFRSASRIGHSDMGANKKRMQRIIAALENEI